MRPEYAARVLLLGAAIALAGGCASVSTTLERIHADAGEALETIRGRRSQHVTHIALPPAKRPAYRAGQVFVFNGDRVRRVRRVENGEVRWGDRKQALYTTGGDFFLPRTYQDRPDRTVRRRFTGDPATLWPLQVGKEVSFVEHRSVYRKATGRTDRAERRWECAVDDARRTHVEAGGFDTYRVTCRSYLIRFKTVRALRAVQTVHYDYAPSLGHFVRRESISTSGRRNVQTLSAAVPANLATPRRIDAVLRRLADQADGRRR